jgi:DNA (cytosine-5)-methyltransferase 1
MPFKFLDVCCCAGGASAGYARAGLNPSGLDNRPQPHYPFEFFQGDALTFPLDGYDFYHASPPCQFVSKIAKENRTRSPGKYHHPNLVPAIRQRLIETGKPYIIESVSPAPLINPVRLCGSYFHLPIRRHRYFESNIMLLGTPCSHQWQKPLYRSLDKRRKGILSGIIGVHGHLNYAGERTLREEAMGIDWMTVEELDEALPPVYTEFLGQFMLKYLENRH